MINEFIEDVCDILNIEIPNILYGAHRTVYESATNTIYISKYNKFTPDLFFALAHELRHVWQYKCHEHEFLSNYKTREVLDVEAYNNQIAEIDANAFASIVMMQMFQLKPLYQGLSKNTVSKIYDYVPKIIDELNKE